jgi:hypothetical protein
MSASDHRRRRGRAPEDVRARLPPAVAEPVAGAWRLLAAVRRARALHPRGGGHHAVLEMDGGAGTGAALFDDAAAYPALVRLSCAVGWPGPEPRGLALRVPDLHGPGRHQDLLLTTSVDVPVLHHLPLPARGWRSRAYSSLLPHRVGGALRLLGALPDGRDPRTYHLALATLEGRFSPVGRIHLGEPLPPAVDERLRFNPWNTGGGLTPAYGPVQRIRSAAYRGSQAGRAARG